MRTTSAPNFGTLCTLFADGGWSATVVFPADNLKQYPPAYVMTIELSASILLPPPKINGVCVWKGPGCLSIPLLQPLYNVSRQYGSAMCEKIKNNFPPPLPVFTLENICPYLVANF